MVAAEALRLIGKHLVRAVRDPADIEARTEMLYAATLGGIAFANADAVLRAEHALGIFWAPEMPFGLDCDGTQFEGNLEVVSTGELDPQRWEATKRIKRVQKGVYEKAAGSGATRGAAVPAKRGPAKKRVATNKVTAGTKRAHPARKPIGAGS